MTYGRAIKLLLVVSETRATVSHGLTPSPPRGGGTAGLGWLAE